MSARWIDQTRTRDTHPDVRGDCTRAAIASLFALPLDAVPDFDADDPVAFYEGVEAFFLSLGYEMVRFDGDVALDSLHLANGPAARGVPHTVVRRGVTVVHDPHPSRAGLLGVDFVVMPVPLDPSQQFPAQMSTRPAAAGGDPTPAVGGAALPGVEEIAEVIHDARWADEDAHRRTPFAVEDRRGREYCIRLGKAVHAHLADHQARPAAPEGIPTGVAVEIDYTNYRGERSTRTVIPTGRLLPGDATYHPTARWVIEAWDVEKAAMRTFDLAHIHAWGDQRPQGSAAVFRASLSAAKTAVVDAGLDLAALDAGDGGAAAGDGWQDIATAPKDGTYILGFGPHASRGHYVDAIHFWSGHWTIEWMHGFSAPTHWRPLPTPPTTSTTTGTEGRDHG